MIFWLMIIICFYSYILTFYVLTILTLWISFVITFWHFEILTTDCYISFAIFWCNAKLDRFLIISQITTLETRVIRAPIEASSKIDRQSDAGRTKEFSDAIFKPQKNTRERARDRRIHKQTYSHKDRYTDNPFYDCIKLHHSRHLPVNSRPVRWGHQSRQTVNWWKTLIDN